MGIVNIAKELGDEGFTDMKEDDVREHLENCAEPFTNEKLKELMQSAAGNNDVMEDTAQVLKDMIAEYELSMEHGIMVAQGITVSLKPLQDLLDEAKKRERQLSFIVDL
ncbi:hypothetical protein TTRE_0000421501 [Trichuris trichiura]|uniref:Uncharacterized protein n=1 Tax=Trichuris trichiura TaxID=36087 RepID=A0A077Z6W6_TRITR|nr:hypothetical protein TTRE_0000421501 [Trichuris trichiura]